MLTFVDEGKVCIRYVDRPVASGAHYEFSLKSKRDRTCATLRRVELLRLRQTAEDGCEMWPTNTYVTM